MTRTQLLAPTANFVDRWAAIGAAATTASSHNAPIHHATEPVAANNQPPLVGLTLPVLETPADSRTTVTAVCSGIIAALLVTAMLMAVRWLRPSLRRTTPLSLSEREASLDAYLLPEEAKLVPAFPGESVSESIVLLDPPPAPMAESLAMFVPAKYRIQSERNADKSSYWPDADRNSDQLVAYVSELVRAKFAASPTKELRAAPDFLHEVESGLTDLLSDLRMAGVPLRR